MYNVHNTYITESKNREREREREREGKHTRFLFFYLMFHFFLESKLYLLSMYLRILASLNLICVLLFAFAFFASLLVCSLCSGLREGSASML